MSSRSASTNSAIKLDYKMKLTLSQFYAAPPSEIAHYFSIVWPPLFYAYLYHHPTYSKEEKEEAIEAHKRYHIASITPCHTLQKGALFQFFPLGYTDVNCLSSQLGRRLFFHRIHDKIIRYYNFYAYKFPHFKPPSFLDSDRAVNPHRASAMTSTVEPPESMTMESAFSVLRSERKLYLAKELEWAKRYIPDEQLEAFYANQKDPEVINYDDDEELASKDVDPVDVLFTIPDKFDLASLRKMILDLISKHPESHPSAPEYWEYIERIKVMLDRPVSTEDDAVNLILLIQDLLAMVGVFPNDSAKDAYLDYKGLLSARVADSPVQEILVDNGSFHSHLLNVLRYVVKVPDEFLSSPTDVEPHLLDYINPFMTLIEVCHIIKRAVAKKLIPSDPPVDHPTPTPESEAAPETQKSVPKSRSEIVAKMKEMFRKSETFTADDHVLFADMKDVESRKAVVRRNDKLKDLLKKVETMKVDVDDWGFIVKKFPVDSNGILANVKLNSHSASSKRDVIFNGVLVMLADMDLFTGIATGDVKKDLPATVEGGGAAAYTIDSQFISLVESITKIVIVATLHSYCQGIEERSLKWYESFQNVCGSFISESRLVSVMKAIHNCGTVSVLMETMTVGEIKSYNNVFTYRLRRYSSPSLVKQALSLIHTDISALCFDLTAVQRYRNFEEAGDLAQIASGPLKVYCKGKIDPLKVDGIPDDLELVHLQRIDEPPYHEHTIRRAKIILDIFGVSYGRWYQGMKAEKTKTSADVRFEALIKKIHSKISSVKDVEDMTDAELRGLTLRIVDGEPDLRSLMGDVVLGGWVTEVGQF